MSSSQIFVKTGLPRKTKSKNFQYFFHSKWKKCLRKIQTLPSLLGNAISDLEMAKPSEILASTTDSEAWNIEVERVAPKLKVTVRVDGRDWRSHLEQVRSWFLTHWPKNLNKKIYPFFFTFWNWIRKGCYFTNILSHSVLQQI